MNSEKMKREIFTEKNEALNVTRLELNKLKGRVKEMDVNSLVKELTRQKDAEVSGPTSAAEDVKVNSTLAVNELKQLANRSTQVTVSDISVQVLLHDSDNWFRGSRNQKNQILHCDCLPKRARYLHLARSGLPGYPRTMQAFSMGKTRPRF